MLIRIFLVIAILGGLAAGGLNFALIKDKVQGLQKNLADETKAKNDALANLSKTKTELSKTVAELKTTQTTLATTTEERDTAVANAASQTKRADKLFADLTATKKTLDDKEGELSRYKLSNLSPEQIAGAVAEIKTLRAHVAAVEQENALVLHEKEKVENELGKYKEKEYIVYLDPSIRGTITASDPKWNFVVVNVGDDQHVLKDGELLVSRNGKLVAKVRVSAVQKDRSVANIMPGWEGEVMEGDLVIPAHPKS
jgi:hypothetical protein